LVPPPNQPFAVEFSVWLRTAAQFAESWCADWLQKSKARRHRSVFRWYSALQKGAPYCWLGAFDSKAASASCVWSLLLLWQAVTMKAETNNTQNLTRFMADWMANETRENRGRGKEVCQEGTWPEALRAANDWLRASERAMCVSSGRQDSGPQGGPHMSLDAGLKVREKRS
jgi:hypothetical protein